MSHEQRSSSNSRVEPGAPDSRVLPRAEQILLGLNLGCQVGAEVGPLDRPLVSKESGTVYYIDHCDTAALKARWVSDKSIDVSALHVDAVWGTRTLREALAQVGAFEGRSGLDYVVASHVVEHVPDLVTWLQEVHDVLSIEGTLRLIVPDKRYTFDIKRRTSSLTDVLAAFVRKRRVPSASRVLDFALNMVQVDIATAWRGELDLDGLTRGYSDQQAMELALDAEQNGTYHDVHCWVFTPRSFVELMAELARCELLGFACDWIVPTAPDTFEFFVSMGPEPDFAKALASWQALEAT